MLAITAMLAIAGLRVPANAQPGGKGDRSMSADEVAGCCSLNLASLNENTASDGNDDKLEFCTTQEHYVAKRQIVENFSDAPCPDQGFADDPVIRNAAIPTPATPIKTYRLSIHVFQEDNGSNPAATEANVGTAVALLNTKYAPWRIQFVYETNFINSTKYRTLSTSSEEYFMKKDHANSPATKLNVYVVNTGGGNWGTFPWDSDSLGLQGGIVMHDFYFVSSTSPVFTHEVGHCLGLWHTHHGVTEVTACGDCYEFLDRTPADGDLTGDRCGDTNPMRNDSSPINPGIDPCTSSPFVLPLPFSNYMSYSLSYAAEFTPQQAGRMHRWTSDALSGWLYFPSAPAAPGTPTLTKQSGGVILVTWADNSTNEDGFRVQRETKSGPNWINQQIVATVLVNTTSTTNSPGTGTFRYRVQAFNGVGDSAWSSWKQIKN